MKTLVSLLALVSLAAVCSAQSPINASQYQVNLSFLTGGPYNQSSALDVTFGTQFTTNNRLQADFITMPGANYTGYFGGGSYDLCGISAVASLLSTTSFSCGKFMPFLTGEAGLGRIDATSVPSNIGVAGLGGIGAGYDPTGAGKFALLFKGGWGHFGPSLPVVGGHSISSNGFFFYSGVNWGGGSSASATQAKGERMQSAERKKMRKLQEKAARANKS